MSKIEPVQEDVLKLLSKPWRNFFDKFKEIEYTKNCKWTDTHQLAYICKRYEETYDRKFAFSFKNAPSKCPEIVFVKRMCAMLGTSNPNTITEYIDWIFDDKIIPKKMNIRSLTFFMTPGLGNEFLSYRTKKNKIEKSTELPSEYKEVVERHDLPISTFGDLAFAKLAVEEQPESREPYKLLLNELYSLGFDPLILKDLK